MDQTRCKISIAMKYLDVSGATIYRIAGRGGLELLKIGSYTRVMATSIDRMISVGKCVSDRMRRPEGRFENS